jgi:hypothetical protein
MGTDNFTVVPDGDSLTMSIDGKDTYVYRMYRKPFAYADVQIDVDAATVGGTNNNALSVVCRYSGDGWYEFNIDSGGLWNIFKYQTQGGYKMLKSGGSTAIKIGKGTNHLTVVCQGDALSLYINDVKVGTAKDTEFADGTFGLSASAFDSGHVEIRFSGLTVRVADPAAQLGGNVAPTVVPSSGGGGGGGGGGGNGNPNAWMSGFLAGPVPGSTVTDVQLQHDTLMTMVFVVASAVPEGCQDVHVKSGSFVGMTEAPAQDAQGNYIDGAWQEVWVVSHCATESSYTVIYAANPNGGLDFSIVRIP